MRMREVAVHSLRLDLPHRILVTGEPMSEFTQEINAETVGESFVIAPETMQDLESKIAIDDARESTGRAC